LVSCVNSRVEDIAQAAEVVKGKKVAEGVEFYIAAASNEVQAESQQRGDWQTLLDAGAIPLPPGCGPCIGLGAGLLEDGEVGISATNRNFKGRMGSPSAEAYLASPAVVAYSAIKGEIDFEWEHTTQSLDANIKTNDAPEILAVKVKILDGFLSKINGDIIYCHQDNMNTDGIYPGKYTYVDDFSAEDQAKVAMENYDSEFQNLVKQNDILVGGYNFGTGSSREQAATALKHRGVQLVIVGSASTTYKRNALNNGFLVIEIPKLVDDLKSKYGSDKLTVATNTQATLDYENSILTFDGKEYNFSPVGTAAQELVVLEGLENWVKDNLG
ncbi:MAG: aconitase family protein, partial [Melioribacteraceae bacterium]